MSVLRSRKALIATLIVVAGVAVVLVAALGSGESEADEALVIRSDDQEKGDPELGPQRIRITPDGLWTGVFWVELEDLSVGEEILSGVNFQLTNCRPSDLTPSSDSSCKGTAPYDFTPTIESKLVLAEAGPNGRPKPSGVPIGRSRRLECTAKLHHCVPALFGELAVGEADTGDRFVQVLVRATNPKAKPCKPARPSRCNVLQLSQNEGRLGVARERRPGLVPPPTTSRRELVNELQMAKTKAQKKNFRKVLYSVKLDKPGPVLVKAQFAAEFELDYPTPPLVNKQLILADSPTAVTGSTVEPQNGENCEGECSYLQYGVLPCLTQADLDAGRQYLNLVAFTSRASAFASPKHGVQINDGGFLESRQYDASLAPEACS